uniref:ATP synthase complex subunit 8 n=1 Tax=Elodes minuta TaxID=877997 RepID=A0A343C1F4_9COLE|nr:ATP synthase F0 subunit 8 [Elodes minuta]YP_010385129.1 ATP synthase F0 subunit 8 [Elodes marginata]ARH53847.1 ATP synthase F0 subunit 8 [Elodes minuta]QMP96570.1 ATP synthase F0 subunit 8 [Elodes minuta]UPL65139.1 ATP synthase F0 subunit 8 [Elodes marginata]
MPQMAPMNWLTLFIMFTIIFIMFNSLNYFTYLKTTPKTNNKTLLSKTLNWKW